MFTFKLTLILLLYLSLKYLNLFVRSTEEPPKVSKPETPITKSVEDSSQIIKEFENRTLSHLPPMIPIRQAWIENLDTLESNNLGLIDLHPDVFGTRPRLDLLYKNFDWQRMYKYIVSWRCRLVFSR